MAQWPWMRRSHLLPRMPWTNRRVACHHQVPLIICSCRRLVLQRMNQARRKARRRARPLRPEFSGRDCISWAQDFRRPSRRLPSLTTAHLAMGMTRMAMVDGMTTMDFPLGPITTGTVVSVSQWQQRHRPQKRLRPPRTQVPETSNTSHLRHLHSPLPHRSCRPRAGGALQSLGWWHPWGILRMILAAELLLPLPLLRLRSKCRQKINLLMGPAIIQSKWDRDHFWGGLQSS